jgi:glutamate-ammonia-ligase adenylyltransferase
MLKMVPSQWFSSAERYLTNPKKAEESFKELLEKHPEPKSLLDYLNERRFILLLRLLDHSECMRKFLINHPTDFQNVIPGLWYVSKRKEDYLRELEELVSPHSEDKKFSEKLAYYRHRELMRLLSKEFLGTAKLEDILKGVLQNFRMPFWSLPTEGPSRRRLTFTGSHWRKTKNPPPLA